jgi:hypothetical protein
MLFSKKKKTQSEHAFTIKKEIKLGGKEFIQTQYATEHYVVTEFNGKLTFFSAEDGKTYKVYKRNEKLKLIDNSMQEKQMEQAKTVMGNISVSEIEGSKVISGFASKGIKIKNDSELVVINGELYKTTISGIEKTAISKQAKLEEKLSPFSLNILENEMASSLNMHIVAQGVEQKQEVTLLSVKSSIEDLEYFDRMLSYKIDKK